jgi:hypothetical protein
MKDMKKIYELLSQIPDGITLAVGSFEDNVTLEFLRDGEPVDLCPLLEITPEGEFIEQETTTTPKKVGPIEALQDELARIREASK